MPSEEIIIGIKNAVARGESLQKSAQSMINAGYGVEDVNEALNYVNMGTLGKMTQPLPVQNNQTSPNNKSNPNQQTPQPPIKPLPKTDQPVPVKSKKIWWIILGILIFILLGAIGAFMIFGDQILQLIFPK
jgi:hypothetical protein